ncbi:hypothetical protein CFN78_14075 [Amycolatopsis antarctica]|uniref:Uncharacterized protein n=1 Tax=Amycolatopsis antarctica TaxID=1854586 RepID=A0A263D2R1_9PSEU|nr:hypothetical protein [Amycolatopsis antarctica]OZM72740.1 hypothetical protein CFN78_14075 [Amycolatopsis antarctica]
MEGSGSVGSRMVRPPPRAFAPWYVTRLRTYFVAVDRSQPVAVSLSVSGQVLDVVSWAADAPAPETWEWPNRRVLPVEDELVVQDLPGGIGVTLDVDADGRLRYATGTLPETRPDTPGRWVHRRFFGSANRRIEAGDGHVWAAEATVGQCSVSARVSLTDAEGAVRELEIPSPGSVTSLATLGADLAVACVQRAAKRPWDFAPEAQLWFVLPRPAGLAPRFVPPLDITDLCRPRPLGREHAVRRQQELSTYLTYSLGDLRTLREAGAERAELTVHGDIASGDVMVDLTFEMPHLPGVRFRRRDCPFDENGLLGGGLRDLNVSLREDLDGGLIEALAPHRPGTVDL